MKNIDQFLVDIILLSNSNCGALSLNFQQQKSELNLLPFPSHPPNERLLTLPSIFDWLLAD